MSWNAKYYAGDSLGGAVLAERIEESINIIKVDDLPEPVRGIAHGKFSARWNKTINGPGTFKFSFHLDDGMRAKVNGR